MNKSPAVLFYTSDFLTGTVLMTNSQKGKYITLLCLQHQQGHLSKEDFFSICDPEEHKIISKFKIDKNGFYYNERMEQETQKREAYSQSRSHNRTQKPLKNKGKVAKNICLTYDKHMENENDNDNIDDNISYKDIIDYLNNKTNRSYNYKAKKNQEMIKARFNEGYTIEDFKKVIDNKCSDWLEDDKMNEYLRPETLFSNKFDGYLNKKRKKTLDEMVEDL